MSAFLRLLLVARTECSLCSLRTNVQTSALRHNSNRASLTRVRRNTFMRTYPTVLVLPDGATINVRHKEPRKIILMPVDLSRLTPEERQLRLLKRKPKQKIIVEEDIDDGFDINEYSHLWKK